MATSEIRRSLGARALSAPRSVTAESGPKLTLRQQILLVMVQTDGPVFGYELIKELESNNGIYTVLGKLERAGLVVSEFEESNSDSGKPARKFYALTADGKAAVDAIRGKLQSVRMTESRDEFLARLILGRLSLEEAEEMRAFRRACVDYERRRTAGERASRPPYPFGLSFD